jgi:hypothetical protein
MNVIQWLNVFPTLGHLFYSLEIKEFEAAASTLEIGLNWSKDNMSQGQVLSVDENAWKMHYNYTIC